MFTLMLQDFVTICFSHCHSCTVDLAQTSLYTAIRMAQTSLYTAIRMTQTSLYTAIRISILVDYMVMLIADMYTS